MAYSRRNKLRSASPVRVFEKGRGFYSLLSFVIVVGSFMGPSENPAKSKWSWLQGDQSESAQHYREGREALDRSDWDAAIRAFEKASEDESRADAALYWIAYAQNKKGNAAAALETIEALKQSYPDSRWVREARALEMDHPTIARTYEMIDQAIEEPKNLLGRNFPELYRKFLLAGDSRDPRQRRSGRHGDEPRRHPPSESNPPEVTQENDG